MKRTKIDWIENKCAACNGSGFSAVKQPAHPGRRIYPPRCLKCQGSGRTRKAIEVARGLEEIVFDVNTLLNTANMISRLGKS